MGEFIYGPSSNAISTTITLSNNIFMVAGPPYPVPSDMGVIRDNSATGLTVVAGKNLRIGLSGAGKAADLPKTAASLILVR